jgi:hypothetical protein
MLSFLWVFPLSGHKGREKDGIKRRGRWCEEESGL